MVDWRLAVANAVALGAMAWVMVVGTETRAIQLVPDHQQAALGDLDALEAEVAASPELDGVSRLAAAYLDRNQPGLAIAAIERAPAAAQDAPALSLLRSRALFGMAQPVEALAVLDAGRERCRVGEQCPDWLVARLHRNHAFVEAVVAAGIEDPARDPEATMQAYRSSTREVRLVAMR